MAVIYHITTSLAWKEAQAQGAYVHPSLHSEGFIHCSLEHQVPGVLERYFAGQTGLVRLEIETDRLTSPLVYDWSPSTQDTYPHVYGPIDLDAVQQVISL
ncbi:MAG: hypothetical protein RJA57_277 [Bacteroidota bacterium]|jgi:uncharacterized protein (DUF952 family)